MSSIKYYTQRKYNTTIHVIEIENNPDIQIMPTLGDLNRRQPLSQIKHNWFEENGYERVGGVNLGFFDWRQLTPYGLMYTDSGVMRSKSWTGDQFLEAIFENGELKLDDVNYKEFVKKYPKSQWGISLSYALVLDGKINLWKSNQFPFTNQSHPRTMIGQKKDKTFVLVVSQGRNKNDKGLTAKESAQVMLDLGCNVAINADGGGSSTMWYDGKVVNKLSDGSERAITDGLLVYRKIKVNKINKNVRITATRLNVRSANNTSGNIVGSYIRDEVVQVLEESGSWYKTDKGWIHKNFVEDINKTKKDDKVEATESENKIEDVTEIEKVNPIKKVQINVPILNIRQGANSTFNRIGQYTKYEFADVYETDGVWLKTDKGWIHGGYVKDVLSEEENINTPNKTQKKIGIDNGHGLKTAGKRTPIFTDGTKSTVTGKSLMHEWEYNRATALYLKKELERCGFETVEISPTEVDTSITARAKKAIDSKVDLLVSIHANAFKGYWNNANGTEQLVCGKESTRIGRLIQDEMVKELGLRDRGLKDGCWLGLVKHIGQTPVVLVEAAFMDNLKEAKLLLDDNFRKRSAIAIAKGICKAYDVNYINEIANTTQEKSGEINMDKVKLDFLGNKIEVDGFMIDGRNYTGTRELLEKIGFKVSWDDTNKTVVVSFELKG